jgi:hypothetical protein
LAIFSRSSIDYSGVNVSSYIQTSIVAHMNIFLLKWLCSSSRLVGIISNIKKNNKL